MRIHITGNAGSGKTSLARELGNILSIGVYGLDKIVWKENWVVTPSKERAAAEEELTRKSEWIIEGVSSAARQSADYVIFLDFPRHVCLKRSLLRSFKYLFSTRPELPKNCLEIKIIYRLVKIIWQFKKHAKPRIIRDINKKENVIISNNKELYNFVQWVSHNGSINYAPSAPDAL